jgi:hypothetical protein
MHPVVVKREEGSAESGFTESNWLEAVMRTSEPTKSNTLDVGPSSSTSSELEEGEIEELDERQQRFIR